MKKRLVLAILGLAVVLVIGGLFVGCTKKDEANAKPKKETVVSTEKKKTEKSDNLKGVKDDRELYDLEDEEETKETESSSKSTTSDSSSKNSSTSTSSKKENSSSNSSSTTSKNESTVGKNESTSNSSSSSSSSSDKKEEEKHSHTWQEVYKEVDKGYWTQELVKEAWTEEVPTYTMVWVTRCNGCGIVLTSNEHITEHTKSQGLLGNFACGGYTTRQEKTQNGVKVVEHPAEYKDVWVPNMVKEVDYYKCSGCGATK